MLSTADEWLFSPLTRRSLSMMLFGASREKELTTFLAQGQGLAPGSASVPASEQGLALASVSAEGQGLAPGMNSLWGDSTSTRARVVSIQGLQELRDSLPLYNPPSPSTTATATTGDLTFVLLYLCCGNVHPCLLLCFCLLGESTMNLPPTHTITTTITTNYNSYTYPPTDVNGRIITDASIRSL